MKGERVWAIDSIIIKAALNGRPRGYADARLANGSINAFTLSRKSAVLRLAPLNVYVYARAHARIRNVRAYTCDAGRNGNGRRSTRRFTVKALFEWSVYWLLNIDILLSGLRKEPRCVLPVYIYAYVYGVSASLSFPLSRARARTLDRHRYM